MAKPTIEQMQKTIVLNAQKHKVELEKRDKQIQELVQEKNDLKKELDSYELSFGAMDESKKNDFTIKKILEFKAKMMTVAVIQDKLLHLNIEKAISSIRNISDNIDALDMKYQVYYEECVKDFSNSIKMDSSALHQTIFADAQFLRDSVSEDLSKCDATDITNRVKLREEWAKHNKTMTDLAKVKVEGEKTDVVDTFVDQMRDNYNKTKEKTKKSPIGISPDEVYVM